MEENFASCYRLWHIFFYKTKGEFGFICFYVLDGCRRLQSCPLWNPSWTSSGSLCTPWWRKTSAQRCRTSDRTSRGRSSWMRRWAIVFCNEWVHCVVNFAPDDEVFPFLKEEGTGIFRPDSSSSPASLLVNTTGVIQDLWKISLGLHEWFQWKILVCLRALQRRFYGPRERKMGLLAFLRLGVWMNGLRAFRNGFMGNVLGEGLTLGGVFVIGRGQQVKPLWLNIII